MTKIYIIGVILFVYSVVLSHVNAQVSSKADAQVVLSADLRVSKEKKLQYTLEIKNNGSNAIYYSANAQEVCGDYGPYISLDQEDSSVVNLQWRIFDPGLVLSLDCVVNKTHVELKKLEPGKTAQDTVLIKWPLGETQPPYRIARFRQLDRKNVKHIRFTLGYFEEEEGILDLLKQKRFGWFVSGTESFVKGAFKGKWLYQGQKLASVEVSIPETKE